MSTGPGSAQLDVQLLWIQVGFHPSVRLLAEFCSVSSAFIAHLCPLCPQSRPSSAHISTEVIKTRTLVPTGNQSLQEAASVP